MRRWLSIPLMALLAVGARGQIPMTREAEDCLATCAAGGAPVQTLWASGGKATPDLWGKAAGDTLAWRFTLPEARSGLRLALRYAYDAADYEGHYLPNPRRELIARVDALHPVRLRVPSTGSWDDFQTAVASLPPLSAGSHVLRVVSPARGTATRADALTLFTGPLESLPLPLRKTVIARSPSGHFLIRATPDAPLPVPPSRLFMEFERIYRPYRDAMGWAPEKPIAIHLIEDARWPDPGATAFQNDDGVFFRAGVMATEQGNWLHEMTHMFYLGHFPRWFDEPSVRLLTMMCWGPEIYPGGEDPTLAPLCARAMTEGATVWEHPDATYDSVQPILEALAVRYGRDVYRRFFHACLKAGQNGEIDFRPGRRLTKDEIVRTMSQAAGEDVGPLFRRWRGFKETQ